MKRLFIFFTLTTIFLSACQAEHHNKTAENTEKTMHSTAAETEQLSKTDQSDTATNVTDHQGQPTENSTLWDIEVSDLDGNNINLQEYISQHKLTLINFWGTYCGPCKTELPDLAKIAAEYQEDNVSVLAIAIDVIKDQPDKINLAKDILNESEAEFTCVMNNEKLNQTVAGNIFAVPTSLLLDTQGNIIGDSIIGAQSYDFFADLIESALEKNESSH